MNGTVQPAQQLHPQELQGRLVAEEQDPLQSHQLVCLPGFSGCPLHWHFLQLAQKLQAYYPQFLPHSCPPETYLLLMRVCTVLHWLHPDLHWHSEVLLQQHHQNCWFALKPVPPQDQNPFFVQMLYFLNLQQGLKLKHRDQQTGFPHLFIAKTENTI